MPEIRIELSEETLQKIQSLIEKDTPADVSAYIRERIEWDLAEREKEKLRVDALLLEGIHSGPAIPVDEAYWAKKRAALIEAHGVAQNA